jgi:hypothetical protein
MLDEVKKQRIIQLVKASSILNEQEKMDWMSLLELMNDKQLQDLEEILKPKAPVVPPQNHTKPAESKASKQNPAPQQPSLKHISNLPTQISPQRVVVPTRPKPPVQPATVPTSKPVVAPSQAGVSLHNINPSKLEENNIVKPKEVFKQPPRTEAKPSSLNLAKLEDVATLTASVLHHESRKSFYKAILQIATQMGYFQTLSYLETSPLYKDYINYGKIKLSNQASQQLPLTQEEFEFMTDLLLSLKINRL